MEKLRGEKRKMSKKEAIREIIKKKSLYEFLRRLTSFTEEYRTEKERKEAKKEKENLEMRLEEIAGKLANEIAIRIVLEATDRIGNEKADEMKLDELKSSLTDKYSKRIRKVADELRDETVNMIIDEAAKF